MGKLALIELFHCPTRDDEFAHPFALCRHDKILSTRHARVCKSKLPQPLVVRELFMLSVVVLTILETNRRICLAFVELLKLVFGTDMQEVLSQCYTSVSDVYLLDLDYFCCPLLPEGLIVWIRKIQYIVYLYCDNILKDATIITHNLSWLW
jgi:hypothetical protein